MTLLPTQWAEVLREAQNALLAYYDDLRYEDGARAKIVAINERIAAALSDQGAKDTANALGAVRLAAEQAYRDLVAVGACINQSLERLEAATPEELADMRQTIRHGLEHVRGAAAVILKALADDAEGPGREIADNHRYLRNLLAGLLTKDRGDFSLLEAGQELGQLHHQMRERIRMAERASVCIAWLEQLASLLADGIPVQDAKARATLYAQVARQLTDGRHPDAGVLDHPLMRDPRQVTQATAEPPRPPAFEKGK